MSVSVLESEKNLASQLPACHQGRESAATSPVFDTLVGMTIRECSVFTKYDNRRSEVGADVKLADLDMKSAKLEKWTDTDSFWFNILCLLIWVLCRADGMFAAGKRPNTVCACRFSLFPSPNQYGLELFDKFEPNESLVILGPRNSIAISLSSSSVSVSCSCYA